MRKIVSCIIVLVLVFGVIPKNIIYANFDESEYKLTGNQCEDIVGIARTQVGYKETGENITKYASDLGFDHTAWCAIFVSWCARKAAIPYDVVKSTISCIADNYGVNYYSWNDFNNGTFKPEKGDFVFFSWDGKINNSNGKTFADHIALISEKPTETENSITIHTIEGNWGNAVKNVKRNIRKMDGYIGDTDYIIGFGRPNYVKKGEYTAAPSLNIALSSYPTILQKGSSFGLRGTISSNYKIKKVEGYIYSGNNIVQSAKDTPNSMTANIKNLNINKKLKFGTLSAGKYSLVIKAVDSTGAGRSITKNFTVEDASRQESNLSIKLDRYPVVISEGSSFGLRGTIKSNYNISLVEGCIVNTSGSIVMTTKDRPDKKTLDVRYADLNNSMKFGKLSAGKYSMIVKATDASGRVVTATKDFTVQGRNITVQENEEQRVSSALSINMTDYPAVISIGKSYGLRGTVTSNYNISKVNGYVIDSAGNIVLSSADYPDAPSMEVRYADLNNSLKFGSLSEGRYILRITATDGISTKEWSSTFEVKGNASIRTGVINIPSGWSNLSIRTGPGTGYEIIGSMNQGESCKVYPDKAKNGWYYVEYNGIKGYASGKQIVLQ